MLFVRLSFLHSIIDLILHIQCFVWPSLVNRHQCSARKSKQHVRICVVFHISGLILKLNLNYVWCGIASCAFLPLWLSHSFLLFSVYLNLPPAPCHCQIAFVTRVLKLSHDLCLPPMSDPHVFLDFGLCLNLVCFVCPSFVNCVWTTIWFV